LKAAAERSMMYDLVGELKNVARHFEAAALPYAVCGGLAVTIHGAVRTTRDIDVLILAADVERAMSALESAGFNLGAQPMVFGAGTPFEREIRRVSKVAGGETLTVDLLLVAPFLADVFESRESVAWSGVTLQVVSLPGLIKMKRIAGRHQDLADIEKLGETPHER
jgi:predicted nucleotidyltransferase